MDAIEDQNSLEKKPKQNERSFQRSFVFCWLVAVGVGLDQLVKIFVFSHMVQPPLIKFKNFQFAFSLPVPVWLMFVIYAVVLAAALTYFAKRFLVASKLELLAWALLFAGASSNIFERIILGYVRDYLLVLNGIFNLADFFILSGIVLLLLTTKT